MKIPVRILQNAHILLFVGQKGQRIVIQAQKSDLNFFLALISLDQNIKIGHLANTILALNVDLAESGLFDFKYDEFKRVREIGGTSKFIFTRSNDPD